MMDIVAYIILAGIVIYGFVDLAKAVNGDK